MSRGIVSSLTSLLAFASLSACQAQGSLLVPASYTAAPSPTSASAQPTATAVTAPESFTSQEQILAANGYAVSKNGIGVWAVFDTASGMEIITANGAGTLVYRTQEGEEIETSAESFKVQQVMGVDVKAILTIENSSGRVESFYLNRVGIEGTEYRYWTSPIEGQTNPEVIENYTPIALEDVWSGRLLYSELLSGEPFPEGTVVPSGFFYQITDLPKGVVVELTDYIEGVSNHRIPEYNIPSIYYGTVRKNNDPRRWTAFYTTETLSGEQVIVGTEQVLAADGRSSHFLHYIFGPEWPWDRSYVDPGGNKVNIIDSVFLAKKNGETEQNFELRTIRPAIFWRGNRQETTESFFSVLDLPTAGVGLYDLPQNNPLLVREELRQMFQEAEETGKVGLVVLSESEVIQFQNMLLLAKMSGIIDPAYFELSE